MVEVRDSDLVLECPCGHIWYEKVDLPMALTAFCDRLQAVRRCPSCGERPRGNAKKQVMLLMDDARRQAIKDKGWTQIR